MVRLIDKPDCLEHGHEFYELTYKGSVYAYVGIDYIEDVASFHINVLSWSHNIAKQLKQDWGGLKLKCKMNGVKRLVASHQENDEKWKKFIKMFGFSDPKYILVSEQEL